MVPSGVCRLWVAQELKCSLTRDTSGIKVNTPGKTSRETITEERIWNKRLDGIAKKTMVLRFSLHRYIEIKRSICLLSLKQKKIPQIVKVSLSYFYFPPGSHNLVSHGTVSYFLRSSHTVSCGCGIQESLTLRERQIEKRTWREKEVLLCSWMFAVFTWTTVDLVCDESKNTILSEYLTGTHETTVHPWRNMKLQSIRDGDLPWWFHCSRIKKRRVTLSHKNSSKNDIIYLFIINQ